MPPTATTLDLSQPTWLIHQEPDRSRRLPRGPFAATRATLDADFHGYYSAQRSALQDELLSFRLEFGRASARPWVIFTCGAMGAGKGHTLRHFHSQGRFPRDHFCVIDVDKFREGLPEAQAYLSSPREHWRVAGTRTQRESGYLSEVALEECLRASKHCVFDSSLQHVEWWAERFARIRRDHPQYRLAIYYVRAPLEAIEARVKRRGRQTGRFVPREVVQGAVIAAPISFAALSPLVDFAAEFDTSGLVPRVVEPTEEAFAAHWASLVAVDAPPGKPGGGEGAALAGEDVELGKRAPPPSCAGGASSGPSLCRL